MHILNTKHRIWDNMPNRTLCSVLEAMRDCDKTKNYSYLMGLIEEAQYLANRMEAALWDQKDFKYAYEKLSKIKKEIKDLEKKRDSLKKKIVDKSE